MTQASERKSLCLGAAQFDAESGNFAANVARHIELIEDAGRRGVDVLVFPELSLSGYAGRLLDQAPERCVVEPSGSEFAPLRDACRRNRLAGVVGGPLQTIEGLILGAIVIDRRGEICTTYAKQNLDGPEKHWFVPGTSGCLIDVDGWRLGLGICYDASFPEHARALTLAGADAYLVSGAFPEGESDHRRSVYFPARALENTVYVAFSNFVGAHDGLHYCGESAVFGPDGRVLANAGPDQCGLAVAEVSVEALISAREKAQMLRDRKAAEAPVHVCTVA